jgi:uncharacterized protein (UPF0276 family)
VQALVGERHAAVEAGLEHSRDGLMQDGFEARRRIARGSGGWGWWVHPAIIGFRAAAICRIDPTPVRGATIEPMRSSDMIAAAPGLGLRAPHVEHVLAAQPAVAWFEVHSENYFAEGGPAIASLERIRERYPVSLHGVGLGLGSCAPLDREHVAKLARLIERIEPGLVSEHLSWGRFGRRHYNELLPLPYTQEALDLVASRVAQVQDILGRAILVENIAAYATFPESEIPEPDFLAALAARSGCGLLLDVNNVYVNAHNHGGDARAFIDAIPAPAVREIHLAGFDASGPMWIDTHGHPVASGVWALYEYALRRFGPQPTLIEWDTDIPPFEVLESEARKAGEIMRARDAVAA